MTRQAWTYVCSVILAAAVLSGMTLFDLYRSSIDWPTFFTFLVFAIVAQLFEAEHGKQSYYPHFVFFFAGVVLLPAFLMVSLFAVPHLVEWGKELLTPGARRRKWYIQPFNIAAHIIPGLLALNVYNTVLSGTSQIYALAPLLAAFGAITAYIGLNHLMVGLVLVMARGISWKESAVLRLDCILPDAIMAALGYVVAVLWTLNPWLVVPALSPLVLMYQALMIPQLKQDAYTDAKTGLWNARHFATLFTAEMERARRFERPIAIIMADLDLLRNINNTYGHLAGDTVLEGIGRVIRENVREYDIAGRFGGEEFAIALPETGPEEAHAIAERLREAVATTIFEVTANATRIQVTMSLGVASFPEDGATTNTLIHEADVAVYQAKLSGRNCVITTSEVPHFVKMGMPSTADRLKSNFVPSFQPRPGAAAPVSQEPAAAAAAAAVIEVPENDLLLVTAVAQAPATDVPQPTPEEQTTEQVVERRKNPRPQNSSLPVLLCGVILSAFAVSVFGFVSMPNQDWVAIALLTTLAAAAELLQMNVYGENTVSVSVALAFAAALIGGIPGACCVSIAIAISHYIQVHPALYKSAFNWATHLLAGATPAFAIFILKAYHVDTQLRVVDLPVLAVPLGLAAILYYMVDTGLIAAAICLSRGSKLIPTWRENFSWLASHYFVLCVMGLFLSIAYAAIGPIGVIVFALPVVMMRFAQKQYVDKTESGMMELKRMNEQLALANQEVISAHKSMRQLNEELFLTLSRIIDARDPYVGNHAAKVADYATAIAIEMGVNAERLEPLRQAGFLHDIGKIAISEEVLHKPSKLTAEEYEYIKTHAPLGGEFLEMCGGLRHLAPFVRHHHERWDGKGYPDCLKENEIPLEARILAVCDAAEAMSSDRPYRKGMSLEEVIAEVMRCSGTQFDPGVAEAFAIVAERERENLVVNSASTVIPKHIVTTYRPQNSGNLTVAEMPVAV